MNLNKSAINMTGDGLLSLDGPVTKRCGIPSCKRTGLMRDGIAWDKKDVETWVFAYKWATGTEGALMNIMNELKSNYDAAESLWGDYDQKLKSFRSQVKNDVTSLESSARKTTKAVQRMQKAYGDVIQVINSEEMLQATENAERLATAMAALASLESHKLTFAVTDNEK